MQIENFIPKPVHQTQSTLLIGRKYIKYLEKRNLLKGRRLSIFLRDLMRDPLLENKIGRLRSGKWKKQYQSEGQDLQRVNFVPFEEDWARLSMISNGTGFSRCFIFVYLMLFYFGLESLSIYGTQKKFFHSYLLKLDFKCFVELIGQESWLKRAITDTQITNRADKQSTQESHGT